MKHIFILVPFVLSISIAFCFGANFQKNQPVRYKWIVPEKLKLGVGKDIKKFYLTDFSAWKLADSGIGQEQCIFGHPKMIRVEAEWKSEDINAKTFGS